MIEQTAKDIDRVYHTPPSRIFHNRNTMITKTYSDLVTPELLTGAIENNEYEGFLQDYHVLHCLIRKYQPLSFFEIGTNMGTGTNIICNAVYKGDFKIIDKEKWDNRHKLLFGINFPVYSLDLPTELAHISLQHPISEGKGDKVGERCKFPYTQLRGDSLTFDFSQYPCDGYFVDSEHDYEHPYTEITKVLLLKPKIVIAHDSDIPDVWRAINDAIFENGFPYELYRVTDTRIAYALRK